ncbi:MAG: protein kinase [bacterium]
MKLLDFGIAKLRRDDPARLAATAKGMTLGTPQYMSPEQATGEPIDARSDIYQVGLLMYELLVGEPPFMHANPVSCMAMHLSARPRPIRERRPSVPEELEAVVLKCLEKRPRDRFDGADALADALDRLAMRVTLREAARVKVDGAGGLVGSLHLPTLGNPADRARFAGNLAEVLAQLWPDGEVPADLLALRAPIEALEAEQARVGTELGLAQAQTAGLARGVEERLRPLERAIEALQVELARLRQEADAAAADERRHRGRVQAIDAEYARLYEEVESHQRTLYAAAEARSRLVDFRDLFRQDIAARLADLEAVFAQRAELTAALEATREVQARTMGQMADLELQLCELRRSALAVESERVTALAGLQLAQTRLEGHRALERALEHHHLRLGLAFRHAVSDLLAERSGEDQPERAAAPAAAGRAGRLRPLRPQIPVYSGGWRSSSEGERGSRRGAASGGAAPGVAERVVQHREEELGLERRKPVGQRPRAALVVARALERRISSMRAWRSSSAPAGVNTAASPWLRSVSP